MNAYEVAAGIRNQPGDRLPASIRDDLALNPKLLTQTDNTAMPIVHLLAMSGQLADVKQLLTVAVLETVWGPGWTVPHVAAQTRCLDAIVEQLANHEHLLYWGDESGNTPVHLAARNGTLYQLGKLLEDPSRLAQPNCLLQTPVHIAALNSNLHQLVNFLTPELLAQKDIQNQPAYKVAEDRGEVFETNAVLKKMVRRAKILSGSERRNLEDVFEEVFES